MRSLLLAVLFAAVAATTASAEARWTLDFKVDRVGTITMRGAQGAGNYLYMVLSVSNKNGRAVPCSLGINIDTDVEGRTYRAGFDPAVHSRLEKKLRKEYQRFSQLRGTIDDGETKTCLVSFGKIDPNVDRFVFKVNGLFDRVYQDRYEWWQEDKILNLTYERPGDEYERQNDIPRFKGKKWEVLGRKKLPRK